MREIKHFFPGGNTPDGFYSYYDYLPHDVKKIYIIKGGPGTGKSTFMKKTAEKLLEKDFSVEYHWCSSDNNSLDGIVCPEADLAVLDGTAPHIVDPVYPGAVEEIIYAGDCWNSRKLEEHSNDIIKLNDNISLSFNLSYDYLKSSEIFFSRWKEIYRRAVDSIKVNEIANSLIKNISLSSRNSSRPGRHLFASAVTPEGPVNYYQNLTDNTEKCYILKGNPGSGKVKILENIARYISRHNYYLLYLHSPLEPSKCDGLIIPELNTAYILDTPLFSPDFNRKQDTFINLDGLLNKPVLQEHKQELVHLKESFNKMIEYSCNHLKKAKQQHDLLEEYYIKAMDFKLLQKKRQELLKKII